MAKIAIVGAGPAGSEAARLLAKRHRVTVFENHPEIGKPVACTGIVSKEFEDYCELKNEFVINTLSKVKVNASGITEEFELNGREYVLSRDKLDKYIAKKAMIEGADYRLSNRVVELSDNKGMKYGGVKLKVHDLKNKNEYFEAFDFVIGSDGPNSMVAKRAGLMQGRKYYFPAQAVIRGSFQKETYEVFLGSVAPDYFAWVVPEGERIARAGLGSRKNTYNYFNAFMKKRFGDKYKDKVKIMQGAPIPLTSFNSKTTSGHVILAGDAAGHNKASTGGGIIPSFQSARIAAAIIDGDGFEAARMRFSLYTDLFLHKQIRNLLNRYDDSDYQKLMKKISDERIKRIVRENSREKPMSLFFNIAITKPSLILEAVNFFNKESY